MSHATTPHWKSLPTEVMSHVFALLDDKEWGVVAMTCRDWREAVQYTSRLRLQRAMQLRLRTSGEVTAFLDHPRAHAPCHPFCVMHLGLYAPATSSRAAGLLLQALARLLPNVLSLEWNSPNKADLSRVSALAGLTALTSLRIRKLSQTVRCLDVGPLSRLRHLAVEYKQDGNLRLAPLPPMLTSVKFSTLTGAATFLDDSSLNALKDLRELRQLVLGRVTWLAGFNHLVSQLAVTSLELSAYCYAPNRLYALPLGLQSLHIDLYGNSCPGLLSSLLAAAPLVTKLTVARFGGNPNDALPPSALQRVTSLRLQCITSAPDLFSDTAELQALRSLDLSGYDFPTTDLVDLWAANSFPLEPHITRLSLGVLTHLTGLTRLRLHGCAKLTSVAHLAALTRLQHLTVADCKQVTSLPPTFTALSCLTFLSFHGCRLRRRLVQFGTLPRLASLSLAHNTGLTLDASFFFSVPNLTHLDLSACSLAKLPDLGPLARLQTLSVRGNNRIPPSALADLRCTVFS